MRSLGRLILLVFQPVSFLQEWYQPVLVVSGIVGLQVGMEKLYDRATGLTGVVGLAFVLVCWGAYRLQVQLDKAEIPDIEFAFDHRSPTCVYTFHDQARTGRLYRIGLVNRGPHTVGGVRALLKSKEPLTPGFLPANLTMMNDRSPFTNSLDGFELHPGEVRYVDVVKRLQVVAEDYAGLPSLLGPVIRPEEVDRMERGQPEDIEWCLAREDLPRRDAPWRYGIEVQIVAEGMPTIIKRFVVDGRSRGTLIFEPTDNKYGWLLPKE